MKNNSHKKLQNDNTHLLGYTGSFKLARGQKFTKRAMLKRRSNKKILTRIFRRKNKISLKKDFE